MTPDQMIELVGPGTRIAMWEGPGWGPAHRVTRVLFRHQDAGPAYVGLSVAGLDQVVTVTATSLGQTIRIVSL